MNDVIFSILLVVVGLFVGAFIMIIFNKLKVSAAQKEADKLIRDAKKEAETDTRLAHEVEADEKDEKKNHEKVEEIVEEKEEAKEEPKKKKGFFGRLFG